MQKFNSQGKTQQPMSVEYNFHQKHDDDKKPNKQRTPSPSDQTALGTKERTIIAILLIVIVTVVSLTIIDVI